MRVSHSPTCAYTSNILLELPSKTSKSGEEGILTNSAPCMAWGLTLEILTSPKGHELILALRQDLQDGL